MKTMILHFCIACLIICGYMLLKNINTFHQQTKIGDAIFLYNMHCLKNGDAIDLSRNLYDELEDYDKTLLRLWDWGYKRIAPPELLEKIKPYIGKRVKHEIL